MKLKHILFTAVFLFAGFLNYSQKYTLNGMVKDAKNNEPIIGAAVYLVGTDIGTATDTEGFFNLELKRRKAKLKIAFIGYVDTVFKLKLNNDTSMTVFLQSETDIEEVEIEDDEIDWNPDDHKIHGDIKDIKVDLTEKEELISEKDKVIIPMVIKNKVHLSEIYLRNGEGSNQNLVFLDGTPVYKSKKLFDFIPFIKDDNAESFQYYYGNFPARFGKHMTSILDVTVEEGNMHEYSGSLDLDLMQGGFSFEGPVLEDRSSFFISARKTFMNYGYTDLFRKDGSSENSYWLRPNFYDINFKYTHKLTESDKLSFHFFTSSNSFDANISDFDTDTPEYSFSKNTSEKYTNIVGSINYMHNFRPDLQFNAGLRLSNYKLKQIISGDSIGLINTDLSFVNRYNAEYISGNNDLSLDLKLNWNPNNKHLVKFGSNMIYHAFDPVNAELSVNDYENDITFDTTWSENNINATEIILYAEDKIFINDKFTIHGGVHFSLFSNEGTTYYSLQPRLYSEYKLHDDISLNVSYAHYKQYVHSLSNYTTGLGSDIFLLSGNEIKPINAHRFAGGIEILLPYDIHLNANAFYDYSDNIYAYLNGSGFFNYSEDVLMPGSGINDRLESGRSDSYGIRVLFKKNIDNLRIAAGHTIANSSRTIEFVNFGETFQYRYNTTHDFKLTVKYIFSEHFLAYMNWVYRSGQYITPFRQSYIPYNIADQSAGNAQSPEEIILLNGDTYNDLGFRNDYQLPAIHRLDIGAEYFAENHSVGIKIYNVYNRKNPDFVDFRNSILTSSTEDQLVTYTIMPFFPTITYSYKF